MEEKIQDLMNELGCSRLEAIASLHMGERSEAAKRALANRARRLELMDSGMSREHAELIVRYENAGI